jgi:hypothetical protein
MLKRINLVPRLAPVTSMNLRLGNTASESSDLVTVRCCLPCISKGTVSAL